jgi:hypothetical protein
VRFVKVLLAVGVFAAVAAPNALAFRFDDAARLPPTGVTGQPFSHALGTVAGCKGVYMNIQSGSLPPGLRLVGDKRDDVDGSNWRIEGVPTTPGEYGFWLEARNLCPVDTTQEDFKIVVIQGLSIQQNGVPLGRVGTAYSFQLTAAGGGNQTWSVSSGALPAGLTLSASGLISGTPTEEARSKFVQVKVSDGSRFTTRNLEISVRAQLRMSAVAVPPVSQVGQPYKLGPLAATGGSGVYQWEVSGLPTGLNFDRNTRMVEGIPTRGGNFPIRVKVSDNEGQTTEGAFTIQIASPVSIVTRRFATLRVGRSYVLPIKVTGGVFIVRKGLNTMNWKVASGKLPLGLRLNTHTGKLIGTPRRAGVYAFSITVTDKFKNTDVESYVLTVKK